MSATLQVEVRGLLPTPTGCGVFLGSEAKTIAIFVDHGVAAAISMSMQKVKKPRPLTHDLIANILTGFGIRVEKVVINDLKGETFYARLFLVQENELGRNVCEIDSRPSDSMAIALHHGCPIHVARAVWDKAEDMTWALEQAASETRNRESEEGDSDEPAG